MLIRSAVIAYWLLGLLGLESWKALALVPSCSCRLSYSVRGSDGGCNCLHSSSLRSTRNLSRRTCWRGYGVSKGHSLATAVVCNGLKCEVSGCGGVGASLEHNERKRGLRKWLLRRGMELTTIMAFVLGVLNPTSVLAATTGDVRCSWCTEEVGSSTQYNDNGSIVCFSHLPVLFTCLMEVIL